MLADLAAITRSRRDGLPPRYYTMRRVRFLISAGPAGGWSIARARDGDGIDLPVPTVYRSGSKPPPMLIADTALYVLGFPQDDTVAARRTAAARHADYAVLIEAFATASSGNPVAAQLASFIRSRCPAGLADALAELGGTSSDLVAFVVDGAYAHQVPEAQEFWAAEVARRKGTGVDAVCLACGTTAPALASLPESIPGHLIPVVDSAGRAARGQPAQLVSINTAAQGRSGVIQLANTPICADCGGDAVAGLTHLLGDRPSRHRTRDSVMVWWSGDDALDGEDIFSSLDKPDPREVSRLLGKLTTAPADTFWVPAGARRFRALTLAANKSRVVIRGQIDISLDKLGDHLTAWFTDHRIDDGKIGAGTYIGLRNMASATGRPSATGTGYLPDTRLRDIEDDLLASALGRVPLPVSLLPHLLHRITHDGLINTPRAALVRLCLRRSPTPVPEESTMIGLNQDAPEAAYQCGRLLRVLEAIQQTAIPEINTTLADRNRAISRNPAVLRGLVENSRAHLKRLHGSIKTRPAAAALEARLDEVLERVYPFPARFTVPEQGLFVLGYHHQRAWDRRQRAAGAAAKVTREANDSTQRDPGAGVAES